MSEASFASLNPTLLARKGGAKPAMRPQLAPLPKELADDALEDLGWNDMGGETADSVSDGANVVALTPGPVASQSNSPIVKRQQKSLAERVLADAVMEGPEYADEYAEAEEPDDIEEAEVTHLPASPIVTKQNNTKTKTTAKGRRAAFTLRLDADRHLKLRLASTMQGVSAQALVTAALDIMLDQIDDLDALAERMKRN